MCRAAARRSGLSAAFGGAGGGNTAFGGKHFGDVLDLGHQHRLRRLSCCWPIVLNLDDLTAKADKASKAAIIASSMIQLPPPIEASTTPGSWERPRRTPRYHAGAAFNQGPEPLSRLENGLTLPQ